MPPLDLAFAVQLNLRVLDSVVPEVSAHGLLPLPLRLLMRPHRRDCFCLFLLQPFPFLALMPVFFVPFAACCVAFFFAYDQTSKLQPAHLCSSLPHFVV